jgi:hypothetical protein
VKKNAEKARNAKPAEESEEKAIIVKFGNASVRVYRGQTRDYEYFQVPDFSSGKRRLLTFSSEKLARAKAEDIAQRLNTGQVEVLKLTTLMWRLTGGQFLQRI